MDISCIAVLFGLFCLLFQHMWFKDLNDKVVDFIGLAKINNVHQLDRIERMHEKLDEMYYNSDRESSTETHLDAPPVPCEMHRAYLRRHKEEKPSIIVSHSNSEKKEEDEEEDDSSSSTLVIGRRRTKSQ